MYRSIVIVFLSFTLCGLTNYIDGTLINGNECRKSSPIVNASRTNTHNCFGDIVQEHFKLDKRKSNCSNVADMKKQLSTHIKNVKNECLPTLKTNEKIILELVAFSLSNDSLKELYSDAKCVENRKPNITRCINGTVGSLNKTHNKHSSWITKSMLNYNSWSCDMSKELKICVEKALSVCKTTTREFVASLFNITISHCHDLSSNNTVNTNPRNPPAVPVAAILGISAAIIIVGVILIIVIIKMKRK